MPIWNPWHGCHKISPGCMNCYVYRRDESIGKDASAVTKTSDYDLPMRRDRMKVYLLRPEQGAVYTCMTSDFFLEDADAWREECWKMIRKRSDLQFFIITKRIHRFMNCIPADWGAGYPNVTICCTCEDQERADARLPIFLEAPICHRQVIQEPMLGQIDMETSLQTGKIEKVVCGGESGSKARLCRYAWILSTREQCVRQNVAFFFKQTGALFEKDGKTYRIERKLQQSQAAKAGIDFVPGILSENTGHEQWLRTDLFARIRDSRFRSRFHLSEKDRCYLREKGMDRIRSHAEAFVAERLAPAQPAKDGSQTPMRGHPVFVAQHACGCCCRGCLEKWHGILQGHPLRDVEQQYVVEVLMEWLCREMGEALTENFLEAPEDF